MNKMITLTDEQYAALSRIAQETKTTPEMMIAEWIGQLINWDQSAYYTDEQWDAHLDELDRESSADPR